MGRLQCILGAASAMLAIGSLAACTLQVAPPVSGAGNEGHGPAIPKPTDVATTGSSCAADLLAEPPGLVVRDVVLRIYDASGETAFQLYGCLRPNPLQPSGSYTGSVDAYFFDLDGHLLTATSQNTGLFSTEALVPTRPPPPVFYMNNGGGLGHPIVHDRVLHQVLLQTVLTPCEPANPGACHPERSMERWFRLEACVIDSKQPGQALGQCPDTEAAAASLSRRPKLPRKAKAAPPAS